MKNILKINELVSKYSTDLGGVFRIEDLKIILNEAHLTSLYRTIDQLVDANILQRFNRGIYTTKDPSLDILSQRIAPESYISFTSVLSENHIVGLSPKRLIEAVKIGKSKTYKNENTVIRHYGINKNLFFGYESKNGVCKALPEKAWLDVLYFHLHGVKFPFSIYEDLDINKLNRTTIYEYLEMYRNSKFVQFAKGQLK